tara:strand:- start:537 stop:791 length:255 start_codon:yes stop_codon:yes gene_type:complete
MKQKTMMKNLSNKFKLNAVSAEEFYGEGQCSSGIWIRGSICKAETDWYNYAEATMEENKLNDYLKKNGWYAEPYDAETIMMFPS